MRLTIAGAAAVTLVLLAGCGPAPRAPVAGSSPSAAPTATSTPPAATPPTATPTAAVPTPLPPPPVATPGAPPASTFEGTIALAPAARVRFGPGLDMPVLDLAPYGAAETFDGWFTRADDTPQTDATTGRIEPWSRDWYRLAGGGGWIHSGAVQGFPPPGLPQVGWVRPPLLPPSTAAIIPVALDGQDQNATCEVASLKMALAHEGISTTEQRLLSEVGVDARPPELDADGDVVRWGDPDQSFVGEPGGRMANRTGYGVYAGPIARAAREEGATVLASGTVAPQTVYANLLAGHPVVAWVTSDYARGQVSTWTAWDGTTVRYSPTEHAVALIGVTPTRVLVNDPWWGQLWKSRAAFETAYATFGGMAVVIR